MDWHKLPESLMRKLNKADCTECMSGMTIMVGCKLVIWNVTHHFKEECTSNSNVGPLIPLLKRVIVAVTAMKKTHKKSVSALMNLIWKAQLRDAHIFKIGIALDSGHLPECEEASWEWGAGNIFCKNRMIYLPDNAALKAEIIKHHHDNSHVGHYTWKWIKKLIQRKFYWEIINHNIYQYVHIMLFVKEWSHTDTACMIYCCFCQYLQGCSINQYKFYNESFFKCI